MQNNSAVDKSPQRIREMFDSIAPRYDFLNHFLSLGVDNRWRKKTAKYLLNANTPPGDVLDVCCGTGDLTLALQRAETGNSCGSEKSRSFRNFYGIDFSEEMVKRARQKSASHFSSADALNLPFEDNRFAVTAVAFGLRNVADTERGLAEMVRVCKPDGTVGVLEFSMPTLPVFAQMYRFYFRTALPIIGRFFSGNRDGAYRYLPESVLDFDEPAVLRKRMEQLGLTDVRSCRMTFGIATLTWGRKQGIMEKVAQAKTNLYGSTTLAAF